VIAETAAFETSRMAVARAARPPYGAMVALDDAVDLDPALRDLVSLRASTVNSCAYCVDMHTLDRRAWAESSVGIRTPASSRTPILRT
jgi:AhpD family alkylhydroperoxidase